MMRARHLKTVLMRELGTFLSLAAALTAQAAHVHVQITFTSGTWNLHLFDFDSGRYDPSRITIPVDVAARASIPNDPLYASLLGVAGTPVWIMPQNEHPQILNLGIGTSSITSGTFTNNQIKLSLHRVDGPGHFALFTSTPFGTPVVHMTSLDGVNPTNDFISVPAVAGHIHLNWAFTEAGTYRIGFTAAGRLNSNSQISESSVVDYTFVVEPLPPPKLLDPHLKPDRTFVCSLESEAHGVCRLESSADLRSWTPVVTVTNTTGRMEVAIPKSAGATLQFFRAALIP